MPRILNFTNYFEYYYDISYSFSSQISFDNLMYLYLCNQLKTFSLEYNEHDGNYSTNDNDDKHNNANQCSHKPYKMLICLETS